MVNQNVYLNVMIFLELPTELYNYVISFIQPDKNIKSKYDFCLIFISIGIASKKMKRCTPCLDCQHVNTYNQICRGCDQQRWFELT